MIRTSAGSLDTAASSCRATRWDPDSKRLLSWPCAGLGLAVRGVQRHAASAGRGPPVGPTDPGRPPRPAGGPPVGPSDAWEALSRHPVQHADHPSVEQARGVRIRPDSTRPDVTWSVGRTNVARATTECLIRRVRLFRVRQLLPTSDEPAGNQPREADDTTGSRSSPTSARTSVRCARSASESGSNGRRTCACSRPGTPRIRRHSLSRTR